MTRACLTAFYQSISADFVYVDGLEASQARSAARSCSRPYLLLRHLLCLRSVFHTTRHSNPFFLLVFRPCDDVCFGIWHAIFWRDDNILRSTFCWSVSQLRTCNRALPGPDDADHQEHRLRCQVDGTEGINARPAPHIRPLVCFAFRRMCQLLHQSCYLKGSEGWVLGR